MADPRAYHRPTSLDEAAGLLAAAGTIAVGGGTTGAFRSAAAVVDLQALGIDRLESTSDGFRIGAMVRLGALAAAAEAPPLLARLARVELPSVLRDQATVGGTVAAADASSVLCAGLLVHEAVVEVHGGPSVPLRDFLSQPGPHLVTGVTVATGGETGYAATGRTPADEPIVAAVARRHAGRVLVALTGVSDVPVLVDPSDPTAGLSPPGDFRGSTEYRRHLARVLTDRAVEELA